jgi:dTDP-4-dehydrorhamnose 3,5-epimerase
MGDLADTRGAKQVGIAGVLPIRLTPHADARGSLTEAYRRSWLPDGGEMVQGNVSHSQANVLRGLHFHREQADYWCLLSGRAFVGLYDLRETSPTFGEKAELGLDASESPAGLYVPPGVAHGFYAETDVTLLYLVDAYFTGTDEFGVAWNDPEIGIAWPSTDPIVSERDRRNPPLRYALLGESGRRS